MNRFEALLIMAMDRTAGLLGIFYWAILGGLLGMTLTCVYSMGYYSYLGQNAIVTYFIVTAYSWINVISLMLFMVIVVFLTTYALEFTYLCWLYDDRTWFLPNWIKRQCARYWKWQHKNWEVQSKQQAARRTNTMKAVKSIKNSKQAKEL